MKNHFTLRQKVFMTFIALSLSSLFIMVQAQTPINDLSRADNPEQQAAQKTSTEVIEIAKKHVREKSKRQAASANNNDNNEGLISFLNKTIEELEERAEEQYRNNRYVFIKED